MHRRTVKLISDDQFKLALDDDSVQNTRYLVLFLLWYVKINLL